MAWVGYGGGAGRIVGVQTDLPLGGTNFDEATSTIGSQVPMDQRQRGNVSIPEGTSSESASTTT